MSAYRDAVIKSSVPVVDAAGRLYSETGEKDTNISEEEEDNQRHYGFACEACTSRRFACASAGSSSSVR